MAVEDLAKEAAKLYKHYGSKANVARELLDRGHSVGAISKAVPMAYSQVHSINKKREIDSRPPGRGEVETAAIRERTARRTAATNIRRVTAKDPADDTDWGELPNTRKSKKPKQSPALTRKILKHAAAGTTPKVKPRSTKLRTGALPSDVAVGKCYNCDFDLVARPSKHGGYMLTHTGMSAEEYFATIQFCQAVPAVLMPHG